MATRYLIRTARKADLATIRDIVTRTFVYSGPTGPHLGYTERGFYKLYDRYAPHIDLETTVVGEAFPPTSSRPNSSHVDKLRPGSGEIVSCHVNVPNTVEIEVDDLTEALPMRGFIGELSKPFKDALKRNGIREDRVLHSLFGATKEEYHGHGVYKKVLDLFMERSRKDKRWDASVAECTSPITRYLKMRHHGWVEENYIKYEGYVAEDGSRPFVGLDGGASLVWEDYRKYKKTKGSTRL